MTKNLMFDSLQFAKILEKGQVAYADIHTEALSSALSQNIYSKHEVDKMIDASLKEFREHSFRVEKEIREDMLKIENRLEKSVHRSFIVSVGILGSLIVIVGAVTTFFTTFLSRLPH